MRTLAAYRSLLGNRPLARLLAGEFVSGIGDWLYIVGILVVIYRETADPAIVGLFGAVRTLPYVFLSIPAGFIVDRFDRRLVLLVTDLLRGACMLGMAALVATDGPVWAIASLAVLAAAGSTFFYPAIGAYIPALARDERELGPANSAWASLDNVGFILGPALGGVLVATGGVMFAFLINALTFAVIAVVLWRLPPSIAERAGADVEGSAEPSPSALRAAARPMTGIVLVGAAAKFVFGGVGMLTVIVAIDILEAGEAATGYLNSAIGVGGLVGALASGVLVLRRRLAMPLVAGSLALGVGAILVGLSSTLGFAMAAIAVVSAGNLVLDVVTLTILQRVTTDEVRGRALGIVLTASTLAEAAGSLALPLLVVAVGAGLALGVGGVAMGVAAVLALVLIGPALTRPASAFEASLAAVARLPIFAGVPPAGLEAALGHLVAVPVASGDVVIRQGDPADRFYIVRSGSFVVTQRGEDGAERELRRLGPDTVFGEIGLLTGSPRTATVTAAMDGELLALEADEFLALVGRGPVLHGRLLGLYAQGVAPTPAATPAAAEAG